VTLFFLTLGLSAEFGEDEPTLEILLGGQIVSSTLVSALYGVGTSTFNVSLNYSDPDPPILSFRFVDAFSEPARKIYIQNVQINSQTVSTENLSQSLLSQNATATVAEFVITSGGTVQFLWSGTGGNDTYNGTSNADTIDGGLGNDILRGGLDDDVVQGGDGIDQVYGDDGNDTLQGGNGDDTLYGGNGDDTLEGGAGADGMDGGAGQDAAVYAANSAGFLIYRTSNDYITVRDTNESGRPEDRLFNIEEIRFDDITIDLTSTVFALNGAGWGTSALWIGTAGNDTFTGTFSADVMDGGAGNDILRGSAGNDTIRGSDGVDQLYGDDGNDTLQGGDGGDTLYGGNGDDTLEGGAGADSMDGGAGQDTVIYAANSAGFLIYRTSNNYLTVKDTNEAGLPEDRLYNVEEIRFNDITFDLTSTIFALNGPGFGTSVPWTGTAGNDTFTGTLSADLIDGAAGNDILKGGAGADIIQGGDGIDQLYGDDGNDVLEGGNGSDTLYGGNGDDTLDGGAGADAMDGGAGQDSAIYAANSAGFVIYRVSANYITVKDTNEVGRPEDRLYNFEEIRFNDITIDLTSTVFALNGSGWGTAAPWTGTAGNDTYRATPGADTIDGGSGNDILRAGYGDDTIQGGDGIDQIYGEDGNDSIQGGNGDDIIYGGAGNDAIDGGSGIDVVAYTGSISNFTFNFVDANTVIITDTVGNEGVDTVIGVEKFSFASQPFTRQGLEDFVNAVSDGIDFDFSWGGGSYHYLSNSSGNTTFTDVDIGYGGAAGNMFRIARAAEGITLEYLHANAPSGLTITGNSNDNVFAIEGIVLGASIILNLGDGNDVVTMRTSSNDTLNGEGGNDSLSGGAGNDTLNGGTGTDTANYSAAAAGIVVSLQAGTAANDGDGGSDILISIENVTGSAFNDIITGGVGINVLSGGNGDDTLAGRGGNDTLNGGAGSDTASYANAVAGATVSLMTGIASNDGDGGTDTLVSIENITGSAFNDTLTGSSFANTLSGGNGDDVLEGRGGNDVLDGGAGTDTANYGAAAGAVTVDLGTGIANDGDGGVDTLTNIENVTGGTSNDTIIGNAAANIINGGNGNDTLSGRGGNDTLNGGIGVDTANYSAAAAGITLSLMTGTASNDGDGGTDTLSGIENVTGSSSADTITGSAGSNTLAGGDGNDTLAGRGGNDTLDGGNGIDVVDFSAAAAGVTVNLSLGSASADGDGGVDTLISIESVRGSAFSDSIIGDANDNVLEGQNGDDTLYGGAGNDILYGDAGIDTLDYSAAASGVNANLLTGLASNDGDGGADTLSGFENVTGSAFGDTITGDTAANVIDGGAGNDTLNGGDGNDTIRGRSGTNTLNGGNGTDLLDYSLAAAGVTVSLILGTASNNGDGGSDTVSNFEDILGSIFADNITGSAAANILTGGNGDDVLEGRGGADTLAGGSGVDTASYANAAAGVTVSLLTGTASNDGDGSNDTLTGIENITGSAFNDTLTGDNTANVILGGNGNDAIRGGGGNDTLDGGNGIDTISFSAAGAVTVNLTTGTVANDGEGGTDTILNFENVTGSNFNDNITGGSATGTLQGGAGNDTITSGSTDSLTAQINTILAANPGVSYSTATGNFYQFVSGAVRWDAADTAAKAATLVGGGGITGHLAHVTSAAENAYVDAISGVSAIWLGGTDTGLEGSWHFSGGLLNNVVFWSGQAAGTVQNGFYTNWAVGQPDNTANADAQEMLDGGTWTDLKGVNVNRAYVIEWEGVQLLTPTTTTTLAGGDGQDSLYGAAGQDIFLFEAASAFNNIDQIYNFDVADIDRLNISSLLTGYVAGTSDADVFVQFVVSGSDTLLQVDANGTTGGTSYSTIAQLNGITGLNVEEMVLTGLLVMV